MKGKPVTFRPQKALRDRLEKLAAALDRDFTWLIEKAIEAHLPVLEQKYAKELRELEQKNPAPGARYPAPSRRAGFVADKPSSATLSQEPEILKIVKRHYGKRRAAGPPGEQK